MKVPGVEDHDRAGMELLLNGVDYQDFFIPGEEVDQAEARFANFPVVDLFRELLADEPARLRPYAVVGQELVPYREKKDGVLAFVRNLLSLPVADLPDDLAVPVLYLDGEGIAAGERMGAAAVAGIVGPVGQLDQV